MHRPVSLRLARAALLAAGTAVLLPALNPGRAQDVKSYEPLSPEVRNRLQEMREGTMPVDPGNASTAARNRADLDQAARFLVYRLTDPKHQGEVKNPSQITMSDLVHQAAQFNLLLPPHTQSVNKLNANQLGYLQEFGKAMNARLRELLGGPERPGNSKPIVRVNAARMLANLAKSGFEPAADTAVEVIANPKEMDAVRVYALEALQNLFAVSDPLSPEKSVLGNDPARERKA